MKNLHLLIPIATVLTITCQPSRPTKVPLVRFPELSVTSAAPCEPTPPDALGPFYKPNAPERSGVGQGYVLSGMVKSSVDCSVIERARIELWLAGPNGQYDDLHRATIFSDRSGAYRVESNFPPQYFGRPPHIHIRVSAKGYQTLVTQHYPTVGQTPGNIRPGADSWSGPISKFLQEPVCNTTPHGRSFCLRDRDRILNSSTRVVIRSLFNP